jgi:hypothetical protein
MGGSNCLYIDETWFKEEMKEKKMEKNNSVVV